MQIPPISNSLVNGTTGVQGVNRPASNPTDKIGQSFDQMLSSLSQSEQQADDLVKRLSMGESVDLHQVMIGLEETDVNFRVAMAIRDKLVDAYREVMRMQV